MIRKEGTLLSRTQSVAGVWIIVFLLLGQCLCAQTTHRREQVFELSEIEKEALALARAQLEAYNNRDIEAFLSVYSDEVKVFSYPGRVDYEGETYYLPEELDYEGKEEMRKRYTPMFADLTDLHCTILSEIVKGNRVIHEESVVFRANEKPKHALCVYVIREGKIAEAHFY